MGRILPIAKEPKMALPPPPPPPPPAPDPVQDEEAEKSRRRAQALLERERGRSGTVLTSFSGLTSGDQRLQRKTLLGE